MSENKSYMDKENILVEGFWKKLGKFFKVYKQIKSEYEEYCKRIGNQITTEIIEIING